MQTLQTGFLPPSRRTPPGQ